MPRPFRSQKKQTRLHFSSSPVPLDAKDKYNVAVRERLANVRYQGARLSPPSQRGNASRDISPDIMLTAREKLSSPLSSPPTSPLLPAQATPQNKEQANTEDEEDDDDIRIPSSKRRKLAATIERSTIASSPRRSTRLNQSSPIQKIVSRRKIVTSARSRARLSSQETPTQVNDVKIASDFKLSDLGSAESSNDEADALVSQPTLRRRNRARERSDDAFVVPDGHSSDIFSQSMAGPSRSRQKHRSAIQHSHANEIFIADDDEVEYMDPDGEDERDPDHETRRRASKKSLEKRARREKEELEEDLLDLQDSSQGEAPTSRTRGGPVTTQRDQMKEHLALLKKKRARKYHSRVIDSEEDDVDDLSAQSEQSGVDIDLITHEPDEVNLVSSDNSSLPLLGAPDRRPETFESGQVEVDEDDDFVVQDDEAVNSNRHSRPHPDIPLQFTSYASAKSKDLFVHIIEWLVKNKVSPAFARNDDLFDLSFSRVDDQVKAQAGSRLISSAWGATFKRAILARPVMTVEALPGLDEDHVRTCDACNRTNHPARYDFMFSGNPYQKDTLEPLDLDKEESSDDVDVDDDEGHGPGGDISGPSDSEGKEIQSDSGSNNSYDFQGHILPSRTTHFYLGRYCAAAAEMGHKLTHWKHHLNTEVLSYLSGQGVLDAQEIVRRDRQSHRRREKEAEDIVDAMTETGVIRELWERFQADLDDARWGMEGFEGGSSSGYRTRKGRSKSRIGSVRVSGADGRIGEWMEGGKYKEIRGARGQNDTDSDDN